ncbi:Mismatch repair ATPase (MutS family) [Aquiflexum balticum DSM 16537]|uniref:Mismatch repair ATPase (MutS family) n=1 Tax=Aquiflexum balticum DSM 16537 TaxID=758820 RepID=A0A1W2GZN8_9BACT|nr:DNA mismatch repair protein [Aquiflexum balticum]SMD42119.1 Mismatch repair ATPase (MutS family) [Aquiflexum balticum DSM 16537]
MEFEYGITDIKDSLKRCKRKGFGLATARFFLFLFMIASLIIGLSDKPVFILAFLISSILFVYLIIQYNTNKDWIDFFSQLIEMEKEREKRKSRNLKDLDSGSEYIDKLHPYSNDLDLFGVHSLFQLINHTVSKSGKSLLAEWMKCNINPDKAKEKAEAIEELRPNKSFLASFEAHGRAFMKNEKPKTKFYAWLKQNEKWNAIYYLPLLIGPIGGILIIFAAVFELIAPAWVGAWIIAGLFFLSMIFHNLQQASSIMPNQGDIKTFSKWASQIAAMRFEGDYLNHLQKPFKNQDYDASAILNSLEQKSFMLQNRFNLMYLIFNMLFWIDFFLFWRTVKWKMRFAKHLAEWEGYFDVWQSLVSLAAFSNEENLNCQVDWTSEKILETKNLVHPLLNPKDAVGNDFTLAEKTKIVLLTGSNMSGKTTFMRTVGINLVLANLGLCPFASAFRTGSFQLFTSMRNTDNLGESVSSFYAELARIKQLLTMAENGEQVLFLLDEILKGTNTVDRIMGSESLIRQLANSNCKGIISTHDIELSQLENTLDYLENKSFHSEIADNEIHFDYKIKEGPCPSFNAHKLMELMGIKFSE